jgi:hypothetical protein
MHHRIKSTAKWVSEYFGLKFPPMSKVTRFTAFPYFLICVSIFLYLVFYLTCLVFEREMCLWAISKYFGD